MSDRTDAGTQPEPRCEKLPFFYKLHCWLRLKRHRWGPWDSSNCCFTRYCFECGAKEEYD